MSFEDRDDVPAAQSFASTMPDAEPAGHGVEGGAGPHDAAADDQDVELFAGGGAAPEHSD